MKGGSMQMSPMPSFFLYTNLLDFSVFLQINTLCKFNKVSFGGRNLRAHSLAGIRCENGLKCNEKIGLRLELENCEKTKIFFNLAFTVFSFLIASKI